MLRRHAVRHCLTLSLACAAWLGGGSPTVHAQSCSGPESTLECQCGEPGLPDSTAFVCEPRRVSVPFTSIFGIGYQGTLDYFVPAEPPASETGYPVVMMFHGGSGVARLYQGASNGGWGARTIRALLRAGYAVLVPHAPLYNWHTNWPEVLAGTPYEWIRDYRYLDRLISLMEDPSALADSQHSELRALLTQLDAGQLFASGLSDGGAQASRMARSWLDGQTRSIFKAIVLNAGSWNTCAANFFLPVWCEPGRIDWVHSPTLLLHAEVDSIVGVDHAEIYARALEQARQDGLPIEWRAEIALDAHDDRPPLADFSECAREEQLGCVSYDVETIASSGHRFLKEAPEAHVRWFDRYLSQ